MHIRSKFDGGKQINRSQSGAWEGRCAGAGLRQNLGPEWGPEAWEKVTGKAANSIFKAASKVTCQQLETDRKRKASDKAKSIRRAAKFKRTNDNSSQAKRDYARHDDSPGVREAASDVPQAYLQGLMLDYYHANVLISDAKVIEIETMPRGQSTAEDIASNMWLAERRRRITSSVTKQIAKCRSSTKVANLVKTLLYNSFRGNAATTWGKLEEPAAREAYLQMKRSSSAEITTQLSGLVIHPSHHWLAASPDDLVYDPGSVDPLGIVEYKNPYKYRSSTLRDVATQATDFCLCIKDGTITLKHTHAYYYRVQAAMFCTGRKWCDFVVRTSVDIHVERINWNPAFWKSVVPQLRGFYFSAILPELALPTLHKGGIREPCQWLKEADNWKQQYEKF